MKKFICDLCYKSVSEERDLKRLQTHFIVDGITELCKSCDKKANKVLVAKRNELYEAEREFIKDWLHKQRELMGT